MLRIAAAAACVGWVACMTAGAAGVAAGGAARPLSGAADEAVLLGELGALEALPGQARPCGAGVDTALLLRCLERGWFGAARELVTACAEAGSAQVDLAAVQARAGELRNRAGELSTLVQTARAKASRAGSGAGASAGAGAGAGAGAVVNPAFEWAQSATHVYLGVKFAHKLDAPACIDLVDQDVSITAATVRLHATCKGKNKRFVLELALFEPIDAAASTWSMASVGRGTMTLVKVSPRVRWERLLQSATDKPRNMGTWWELHEKYKDEVYQQPSPSEQAGDTKGEAAGEATDAAAEAAAVAAAPAAGEGEGAATEAAAAQDSQAGPDAGKLEEQREELKKKAKQDSKRVNKEAKKALKAVDANGKERLAEQAARHQADKDELEASIKAEREAVAETKRQRQEQIDAALAKALAALDAPASATGGWAAAYGAMRSMSSMLFGSAPDSGAEPDEVAAGGGGGSSGSGSGSGDGGDKEL